MPYELAERNGWLYVKETTTDIFEPRYIIHYWPTGKRFVDFAQYFATPERAQEALGCVLYPSSNITYRDVRGWTYRLTDGGQTLPEYTDLVPIPEPKQRGRKMPMEWKNGEWYKRTARGLVRA